LSTHLRLSLPSGLLLSGFPTNVLHAFLFTHIRATCLANLIYSFQYYPTIRICEIWEVHGGESLISPVTIEPSVSTSLFGPEDGGSRLIRKTKSCHNLEDFTSIYRVIWQKRWHFWLVFRRCSLSDLSRNIKYLYWDFRNFLQANIGNVPQIRSWLVLSHNFHLILQQSSYH
jgi:hypothetical protein